MQYSITDLQNIATSMAASYFFRIGKEKKPMSPDQIFTLMLISAAEGRHPVLGVKDYDIVDGKPAKKTDSMLRDFLQAGGKVEWHALADTQACATFSHPAGGSVKIEWNVERAKRAELIGRDVWQKYMRQMMRSRCVSEGVRTVYPSACSAMYCTEEMADMGTGNNIGIIFPGDDGGEDVIADDFDKMGEYFAKAISESMDLAKTFNDWSEVFMKLAKERPAWMNYFNELGEARDRELKKIVK